MDTENVKLENENCFGSKLSNTFQFLGFFSIFGLSSGTIGRGRHFKGVSRPL